MKKIIAILMAVICVCTVFAVGASAKKGDSRENSVKVVTGVKGGGGGGEITPPSSSYSPGDTVTFHIIPYDGYRIKQVWVNGVAMGPISEYTFENIQTDSTIYAEFEKISDKEKETTKPGTNPTEATKPGKKNGGSKSPKTGANVNSVVLCSLGVLVVGSVAAGTITKKNRKED